MELIYAKKYAQKMLRRGMPVITVARKTNIDIGLVEAWQEELVGILTMELIIGGTIKEKKSEFDTAQKTRQFKTAEKIAREALELVPDDIEWRGRLMQCLIALAKDEKTSREEALRIAQKVEDLANDALSQESKNIPINIYLLHSYEIQGKEEDFQRQKERINGFRIELSAVVDKHIEYVDAGGDLLRIYRTLRTFDLEDVQCRRALLKIATKCADIDFQIRLREEIIRIDKNDKICRMILAALYRRRNNIQKARIVLEELRELDPTDLKTKIQLVAVYQKLIQKSETSVEKSSFLDKIRELLKEIRDLDCNDKEDINNIVRLYIAQTKLDEVSPEEREELEVLIAENFEKLRKIDNTHIGCRMYLLREYRKRLKAKEYPVGEFRELIENLGELANEILAIESNNIDAKFLLYEVYMCQGNLEGAEKILLEVGTGNARARSEMGRINEVKSRLGGIDFSVTPFNSLSAKRKRKIRIETKIAMMKEYNKYKNYGMLINLANELLEREPSNSYARRVIELYKGQSQKKEGHSAPGEDDDDGNR